MVDGTPTDDRPSVFSRRCITLAWVILSNGYSRDDSLMTFGGTGVGSLPSIGQTVLGDLNIGRTDSSTEPFFSVVADGAVVFDKLVVAVMSGVVSADPDAIGGTVEGDCECCDWDRMLDSSPKPVEASEQLSGMGEKGTLHQDNELKRK